MEEIEIGSSSPIGEKNICGEKRGEFLKEGGETPTKNQRLPKVLGRVGGKKNK